MTNKNSNLRFLLALGGKKVVVMQQRDNLQVYSDSHSCRTDEVTLQRISEAVSAR